MNTPRKPAPAELRRLSAWLDGQLQASDARRFEQEAAGDPVLRTEQAAMEAVELILLEDTPPRRAETPDVRAGVLGRIAEEESRRAASWWRRLYPAGWGSGPVSAWQTASCLMMGAVCGLVLYAAVSLPADRALREARAQRMFAAIAQPSLNEIALAYDVDGGADQP